MAVFAVSRRLVSVMPLCFHVEQTFERD